MLPAKALWSALAAVSAAAALGACGTSSPTVSAQTLLQKAKATADAAQSVHFKLSSKNVAMTSTNLVGGEGDLVRPDSLQGAFTVAINGFTANVSVASVNGVFEAKLPFSAHYQKADPASFGLTDPAQLFDPQKGLTNLLAQAQGAKLGPTVRSDGELLDTVDFTVPGTSIPVLPDANPAQPVNLTAAIDPSTYELRTVTLVGPLTTDKYNSTFILDLTNYNEHVTVTLPAAS